MYLALVLAVLRNVAPESTAVLSIARACQAILVQTAILPSMITYTEHYRAQIALSKQQSKITSCLSISRSRMFMCFLYSWQSSNHQMSGCRAWLSEQLDSELVLGFNSGRMFQPSARYKPSCEPNPVTRWDHKAMMQHKAFRIEAAHTLTKTCQRSHAPVHPSQLCSVSTHATQFQSPLGGHVSNTSASIRDRLEMCTQKS